MGIKAELLGVGRLGLDLFCAIFDPTRNIYHCPACHQTLRLYQKKCDRCKAKIGWE